MGRRAVGVLVVLVACATPYQPKGAMGGYADSKIADDTYHVTFAGNGYTGLDDAQHYVMRRAGELCPQGFDLISEGAVSESSGTFYQRNGLGGVNAYNVNRPQAAATVRCRGTGAVHALDPAGADVTPLFPPPPIEPWAQRRIYAAKLNASMATQKPATDVRTEGDADDVLLIESTTCGGGFLAGTLAKRDGFLPGMQPSSGVRSDLSARGFIRTDAIMLAFL